jgi:hypothetical protein
MMRSLNGTLVKHWQTLRCMTDGCTRAAREQERQEHVRGRGDSKHRKQVLLSVHRSSCAQPAAQRGMCTPLVCSVTIWS